MIHATESSLYAPVIVLKTVLSLVATWSTDQMTAAFVLNLLCSWTFVIHATESSWFQPPTHLDTTSFKNCLNLHTRWKWDELFCFDWLAPLMVLVLNSHILVLNSHQNRKRVPTSRSRTAHPTSTECAVFRTMTGAEREDSVAWITDVQLHNKSRTHSQHA
jgi:hypothetical protein